MEKFLTNLHEIFDDQVDTFVIEIFGKQTNGLLA